MQASPGHVLIVDDDALNRRLLAKNLEDAGHRTTQIDNGFAALAAIQADHPDLVLLDIWMPDTDGISLLKEWNASGLLTMPVVMMSGHGTIETAVRSTKLGAYDFIEKPLSLEKVLVTVKNAIGMGRLVEENDSLRSIVLKDHEMVGAAPSMNQLRDHILMVAPTNASVLITGENGTGKELVARSIHFHSLRRDKPFIEINCAAIPEELIESELFGHERGAFTGAVAQKKGKFDLADGGTIFLDEIGDMSLKTQAKVLRILQERKFERVGGTRTVEVDVRVVAATNKVLEYEIKAGNFREDLFYRLNVVPFMVPSLRERTDDIPLLIEHFLDTFCKREGRERKLFVPEAVELMKHYDWPGNVRELKNIIERALIIADTREILPNHLPLEIRNTAGGLPASPPGEREIRPLWRVEDEYIEYVLRATDNNHSRTASMLGISRSTLLAKLKKKKLPTGHKDCARALPGNQSVRVTQF